MGMSHDHAESEQEGHDHSHGAVDPSIVRTERGIFAVKVSFAGLMATAILQVVIVYLSGSVGLLADTIHNFADASTAIPLYVAFLLKRKEPTDRFPYGYGRVEDLAGVFIVVIILFTAVVAGYESVKRLIYPEKIGYLWAVAGASVVGFLGNEAVALYRISVGEEIGSAALVADGYHARVDGLTSLAVLVGAAFVWSGNYYGVEWLKLADPMVGIVITIAILKIVYDSAKTIFGRLLDGVDPEKIDRIRTTAAGTEGVEEVTQVRARWMGHDLLAEINVAVDDHLTVEEGHEIAKQVRHNLLHELEFLARAVIHVDPESESGEEHHVPEHHRAEKEEDKSVEGTD